MKRRSLCRGEMSTRRWALFPETSCHRITPGRGDPGRRKRLRLRGHRLVKSLDQDSRYAHVLKSIKRAAQAQQGTQNFVATKTSSKSAGSGAGSSQWLK